MGGRLLVQSVAAALAGLALAPVARGAGEPIMPLSQVRPGMQCTARSVLHGTAISTFDANVIAVVDGQAGFEDDRILMGFHGPALAGTGVGEGFSGSPVSCRDAQGGPRVVGAISEGVGEWDNDKALVTPIEQMLSQSPHPPVAARAARPAGARSLTELMLGGVPGRLAPLFERAARRAGRRLVVVPGGPASGRFPPQPLVPGAAVSAAYADGDYSLAAIGTVTYRDGNTIWAFGHPLDGAGRRSLLLQDAYVYDVIAAPEIADATTFKLAAPGHTLGTLTADGLNAVAGVVGPRPGTVPFTLRVRDADTGRVSRTSADIADETDLGDPAGDSPLDLVAAAAVAGTGSTVLGGASVRQSGAMCVTLGLREWPKPIRVCNRYVGTGLSDFAQLSPVAGAAADDVATAVQRVEDVNFTRLHVTRLAVRLTERRGLDQGFIRGVRLPRRVRPGQRVRGTLSVQRYEGATVSRRFSLRIPTALRPGRRTVTLEGSASGADEDFEQIIEEALGGSGGSGDRGPDSVHRLVRSLRAIHRWDGVEARFTGLRSRGSVLRRAYRDPRLLVSGRARTRVRVVTR